MDSNVAHADLFLWCSDAVIDLFHLIRAFLKYHVIGLVV